MIKATYGRNSLLGLVVSQGESMTNMVGNMEAGSQEDMELEE